jgi:hypothetical protein
VAISNVANVKFELPRLLNPGYSFQLCCVAKLVIVVQEDLAKFGYRPGMKIEKFRYPFIYWLPAGTYLL